MNFEMLEKIWCRLTHAGPMWPIHGTYRCSECLRQYPVPWGQAAQKTAEAPLYLGHPLADPRL